MTKIERCDACGHSDAKHEKSYTLKEIGDILDRVGRVAGDPTTCSVNRTVKATLYTLRLRFGLFNLCDCNPKDACATHGRCWTHSDWDD